METHAHLSSKGDNGELSAVTRTYAKKKQTSISLFSLFLSRDSKVALSVIQKKNSLNDECGVKCFISLGSRREREGTTTYWAHIYVEAARFYDATINPMLLSSLEIGFEKAKKFACFLVQESTSV